MKKFFKIIGATIAAIIMLPLLITIILAIFGVDLSTDTEQSLKADLTKTEEELPISEVSVSKEETVTEEKPFFIPGLKPVDVYLNMENKGFNTKSSHTDFGHSWKSKFSQSGIDYEVITYSSDDDYVESVSATAIITPPKKAVATQHFLEFVASIPYENAKPEEAAKWVANHFNNDGDSTVIAGVLYKVQAPTDYVRMLRISKAN
jgi:hypothetical protein